MLTRPDRTMDHFAELSREVDRLFESMFASGRASADMQAGWFSTPLNLWEDDSNVYVETEVPGVRTEHLEILATGDTLTVKGQREMKLPDGARILRRERGWGTFERKTLLPTDVEIDKVEASLRDGVLTVRLPKSESRRPRRVEVKASAT